MSYLKHKKFADDKRRTEQGELDIVCFSWDRSEAAATPKDVTNYYSEIQSQLSSSDWAQLPVEICVGAHPDITYTLFLPPRISLSDWVGSTDKAYWLDFLVYMDSQYFGAEEHNYRVDLALLIEARRSRA